MPSCAVNPGTGPAEDVLLELETSGVLQVSGYPKEEAELHSPSKPRLTVTLGEPPAPPRARHRMAECLKDSAERDIPTIAPFPSIAELSDRRQDDAF